MLVALALLTVGAPASEGAELPVIRRDISARAPLPETLERRVGRGWTAADNARVAEALAPDWQKSAWRASFLAREKRAPRVGLATVMNRTALRVDQAALAAEVATALGGDSAGEATEDVELTIELDTLEADTLVAYFVAGVFTDANTGEKVWLQTLHFRKATGKDGNTALVANDPPYDGIDHFDADDILLSANVLATRLGRWLQERKAPSALVASTFRVRTPERIGVAPLVNTIYAALIRSGCARIFKRDAGGHEPRAGAERWLFGGSLASVTSRAENGRMKKMYEVTVQLTDPARTDPANSMAIWSATQRIEKHVSAESDGKW